MKCRVVLTEAERITLQQLAINHKHRDIRCRASGLLALANGQSAKAAAAQVGASHQSAYNWRDAWLSAGITGLLAGHKGGRPPALNQRWTDLAVVIAKAESLSLAGLAKRMEAEMDTNLPCTLETLGATLKAQGFSYKRARFSLKKA